MDKITCHTTHRHLLSASTYTARQLDKHLFRYKEPELSTGRMDPRVGSGRVGSGRAGSGHDFARFRRVGSGRVSISDFFSFSLIIPWFLNRYESSNTTFGLIDFLRYLLYKN